MMDNECEPTGTSGKWEMLEEAKVGPIAMVMRRLERLGHVKGRDGTETSEQLQK